MGATGGSVDLELRTIRIAGIGVTLGIDAVATAILCVRVPSYDKTAVVGGDTRSSLIVGGEGINKELAALGNTTGIVTLGIDTVARTVCGGLIGPGDHKSTIRKTDGAGIDLMPGCGGIDPELRPGSHTRGRIALGIDTVAPIGIILGV